MTVYINDPQNSKIGLLQLKNIFSDVVEYKMNSKISVALLYTRDEEGEK